MSLAEGASLVSLAGFPLVLKLVDANLFGMLTSLSPFHFTLGAALLWRDPPPGFARADLFEIWSLILLVVFYKKRTGVSGLRASLVVGLSWALGAAAVTYLLPVSHGS